MTRAERLFEEMAIERLIRRYAFFNDALDHDALAEMFTKDGSFARPTDPDSPVQGKEALRAFFRDRPARHTRHLMCNTVVEIEGPEAASARSYVVMVVAPLGEGKAESLLAGDFHDRLMKVDGEWKFQSRRGTLALKGGLS